MTVLASSATPVPVVRLIIPDAEGKVLILQRAESEYAGRGWCLPGGKVDYGETVQHAVRRELEEETSLPCEKSRFLFYQDSLPPEPGGMHCINLYFECAASGEVILEDQPTDWAWVGAADLGDYELLFLNDKALERYWRDRPPPRDR